MSMPLQPLYDISTVEKLKVFAKQFATDLRTGTCVCLTGDLGTGKTTFVRALLRILGVEGEIPSPTYTLLVPYETSGGLVWHIDAYRLSESQPLPWSWQEAKDAVVLVEWGERIRLPKPVITLTFELAEAEKRVVRIS